jgi:hypothetical protein
MISFNFDVSWFQFYVACEIGRYIGSFHFNPASKGFFTISVTNNADGRELIFDCDWGIGYYPLSHSWPVPSVRLR